MNDSSCTGKMQICAGACGRKAGKSSISLDPSLHHHIGKSSDSRPLRSIYHFHRSSFLLFEKYATRSGRAFLPVAFFALVVRGIMVGCWNILGRNVPTQIPASSPHHRMLQTQSALDMSIPFATKNKNFAGHIPNQHRGTRHSCQPAA